MSKLKINANGTVDFITRAGNDYVKHSMPAYEAEKSLKQTNQPLIPKLSPVLRYERASIGLIARMILRNKP